MKIYVVTFDLTMVLHRLLQFNLQEFNHEYPSIFIEAPDPDEACYLAYCKFSETLFRKDSSKNTANLIKELEYEIRITKVTCKK